MKRLLVPGLVLGFSLSAMVSPVQAAEGDLVKATFCHGLGENNSPKDTAEFFRPDETVYLSVELKGRPKTGEVAAKFLFREDLIAETKVDVATANEGVIFSFGQNTFVGFTVTHEKPLPVGECYTAEVTFDGKAMGTFPFKIAPPEGAIPSQFLKATLSKDKDEDHQPINPSREFEGLEKVYLTGIADLGLASWLEVTWKVNGEVDPDGTKSFTLEENKEKVPFSFTFIPAGGWPAGNHEASLQLNGKEVAKEVFTVKVGAPMAGATKLEIQSSHLHADDGQGEAGEEVAGFRASDKVLHAKWKLKEKALAKGVQFVWVLVEVEGEKPQELATADVEAAVNDEITSSLTTKAGLPAGKYRVDFLQNGKVLDSKPFNIK